MPSRWESPLDRAALARDFTQAVSDTLVPRAMEALRQTGRKVLCAAGGVAANSIIRSDLERACGRRGAGCAYRRCPCAAITAP